MKVRSVSAIMLFAALPVMAQEFQRPYGFQPGTLAASFGFGGAHMGPFAGVHPGLLGMFDVGVTKYIGVFGEGGWLRIANINADVLCGVSCNATANAAIADGGLEIVGTNHSRFVPYGKVGGGYLHNGASGNVLGVQLVSASFNHAEVTAGGGIRVYLNHRFGVDGQLRWFRTLNNVNAANNYIVFTVGIIAHMRK